MLASMFDQRCEVFTGRPVGKLALQCMRWGNEQFRQHSQDTASWRGARHRWAHPPPAACCMPSVQKHLVNSRRANSTGIQGQMHFKSLIYVHSFPPGHMQTLIFGVVKILQHTYMVLEECVEEVGSMVSGCNNIYHHSSSLQPSTQIESGLLKPPQGALDRAGQASGGTI